MNPSESEASNPPTGKAAATPSAVDYERGTLRGWPRSLVRWLLLQAIRPFVKLTLVGLEHVPARAPFLFVANHLHNADPVLLEIALNRPIHFMAKQELFRNPVLAWFIRRLGTFPVDRGRPDRAAIRHAEALLANGIPVGMFPEGTRSTTGALQPAFPGAGLIAVRSRAEILPASIVGTERLFSNQPQDDHDPGSVRSRFRRPRVTIRFGSPVVLQMPDDGARLSAAAATDLMMQEIAQLLPDEYQGVYRQSPAVSTPATPNPTGDDHIAR